MAAQRISPAEAQERLANNADTMLVCAYDTNEKCRKNGLSGATSLKEFQARVDLIPKNREIIFLCACPAEEMSTRWADHFAGQGFRNVKVVEGGLEAWREARTALAH